MPIHTLTRKCTGEGVGAATDKASSKVGGAVDAAKGLAGEAADTARATGEPFVCVVGKEQPGATTQAQ